MTPCGVTPTATGAQPPSTNRHKETDMGIKRYAAKIDVAAYDRAERKRRHDEAAAAQAAFEESMAKESARLQRKIDARIDAELRAMTETGR